MRPITEAEKRLHLAIIRRYGRSSPTLLARDIAKMRRVEVSRANVYEVMRGRNRSMWLRRSIAKVLGIPVRELFPNYGRYRKKGRPRKNRRRKKLEAA